jgi:hypothetical protein
VHIYIGPYSKVVELLEELENLKKEPVNDLTTLQPTLIDENMKCVGNFLFNIIKKYNNPLILKQFINNHYLHFYEETFSMYNFPIMY